MPYAVTDKLLPVGHAAKAAKAGDSIVSVQPTYFTSTEDGQRFIRSLENIANPILEMLATQCGQTIPPSQVDNLLVIVRKDCTATVYLNELKQLLTIRASRPIKAGEPVSKNDIVDIHRMELGYIAIAPDAGVLFLFSIGWRKGLFYDFLPLSPISPVDRSFDCPAVFAQLYGRVLFQERFNILESEWNALFLAKLFPFAGLGNDIVDSMLSHLRAGWNLDEFSETIVTAVRQKLEGFLDAWRKHPAFAPHIPFLECAAKRFTDCDYIPCVAVAFPRIEGILRTHHIDVGRKESPAPPNLAESAVASIIAAERCLLLPERFRDYLKEVYFASFDRSAAPCDSDVELSRHSFAHGVVAPEAVTPLTAAISFLILHQLFYSFGPVEN